MLKKNPIAKDLRTKKYKQRVVKPKKGKGSYKRKKN
jgi:stalled ribosome alternative rescue factor ArfA